MATTSKSKMWFKENVSENQKELMEIGELSNRMLHEKISLGLNDPMTTIAIYAKIFDTICDVVVDQEANWEDFCLNIADRLKIGYTTTSSDDDEKVGNFMIFMQHVYGTTGSDNSLDDDEDEDDTIVLCTQWNAANVKAQSNIIKDIAAKGKKALDDIINIKIESHEFVIPMFCIIHSQIINYIRLKRVEENKTDYEINVAGLFTVGIQETDDAEEEIYYVPSISLKLKFKNDSIATGKNE